MHWHTNIKQKYIEQILKRFNMQNCKILKTPGNPNEKLSANMVNETNDLTGKVQELVFIRNWSAVCYMLHKSRGKKSSQ